MIPLISGICVEEKGWITSDEMMDVTVVAESTPGPMAINCATYVGWKMGGMAGAVAGTLGIVTPALQPRYPLRVFPFSSTPSGESRRRWLSLSWTPPLVCYGGWKNGYCPSPSFLAPRC